MGMTLGSLSDRVADRPHTQVLMKALKVVVQWMQLLWTSCCCTQMFGVS